MGEAERWQLSMCLTVCEAVITGSDMLPGYDKQHTTDTQVSQQNIHPDIRRQGVEEGEDPRVGPVWLAVQYTYTQRHEGLGEVDDLLAHICDGERSHCQISSLSTANIKEKSDRP